MWFTQRRWKGLEYCYGGDFWKAKAIMRIRKRLIERYPNTHFKSLRLNPISYKTICKCRGSIKHITNPRSNKGIIVMRDEHIKARTKRDDN